MLLDPDELYMCSYGPKFSSVNRPPCQTEIMDDYDKFSRRIYIRDFMHQIDHDGDDVPAKFRLKNPDWHPRTQITCRRKESRSTYARLESVPPSGAGGLGCRFERNGRTY